MLAVVTGVLLIAVSALIAHSERRFRPAQKAELQAELTSYTACLRAGGIDAPDPTFSASGPPTDGFERAMRRAAQSAKFSSVSQRCARSLPPLLRDRLRSLAG